MEAEPTVSPMFRIPDRSRRLRWLALLDGLITLLWLSREDNDVAAVATLGWAMTILLLAYAVTGQLGRKQISARYVLVGGVLLGALAGLGSALLTTGLMLFKNAPHSLFADVAIQRNKITLHQGRRQKIAHALGFVRVIDSELGLDITVKGKIFRRHAHGMIAADTRFPITENELGVAFDK